MSFGGESGVRKVGLCGTHPLTQRYVSIGEKAYGIYSTNSCWYYNS
ncbi:DUF3265 domain-containing protein [Vibrio vulnificus]|nr:DUF3265 domain-containing protein [Vibrio vulnificus]